MGQNSNREFLKFLLLPWPWTSPRFWSASYSSALSFHHVGSGWAWITQSGRQGRMQVPGNKDLLGFVVYSSESYPAHVLHAKTCGSPLQLRQRNAQARKPSVIDGDDFLS